MVDRSRFETVLSTSASAVPHVSASGGGSGGGDGDVQDNLVQTCGDLLQWVQQQRSFQDQLLAHEKSLRGLLEIDRAEIARSLPPNEVHARLRNAQADLLKQSIQQQELNSETQMRNLELVQQVSDLRKTTQNMQARLQSMQQELSWTRQQGDQATMTQTARIETMTFDLNMARQSAHQWMAHGEAERARNVQLTQSLEEVTRREQEVTSREQEAQRQLVELQRRLQEAETRTSSGRSIVVRQRSPARQESMTTPSPRRSGDDYSSSSRYGQSYRSPSHKSDQGRDGGYHRGASRGSH